ncbi:MAG: carbohydrate kinase [bacterium]
MKSSVVVGLGEVLWDVYPDGKHLGGAPANVAIHAHRLGAEGIVASAVGCDGLGGEIIAALEEKGLDALYVQRRSPRPTGTVGVTLNEKGVPSFACSKDVAFDYIEWNDDLERLADRAAAVVVGTLGQRNKVSRRTIQEFISRAEQAIRVFDVNFRGWNEATERIVHETLIHTDILKLNENEMGTMRKALGKERLGVVPFLDWLVELNGLRLVALSLGSRGCLLTDGKERVLSPGIRIQPVDTTGCGDGFAAGLIVKVFEGASLEETAVFANTVGAFLATMPGATPMYSQEDLDRFQKKYSPNNRK